MVKKTMKCENKKKISVKTKKVKGKIKNTIEES